MIPRNIIVPLDGSEFAARAIPVARALADRIDAGLIVMSTDWDGGIAGLGAYLDRVAKQPGGRAAEVMLVDEHPAAHAIASVSRSHPDSVVCMASHGRNGPRWAVLGSVTEAALGEARVPMFVVGRHTPLDWHAEFEHLVVCVSGTDAAEPDVPAISAWAHALGLDIRVVLVTHPLDGDAEAYPNKVVEAVTADFVDHGLAATAVPLRGVSVAGTIADFAKTLPATLVATRTNPRHGIVRAALGSVAMGVVSLAPCPVLVTPSP